MSLADKIVFIVLISVALVAVLFITFEMGKKRQCELDRDYVFSYDYSKCIKIGAINIK